MDFEEMTGPGTAVREALDRLIDVEEHANRHCDSMEQYRAYAVSKEAEISAALAVLTEFGKSLQPADLEEMQEAYYGLTNDERLRNSPVAMSAVRAYLDEAWSGIGPWER